MIPVPDPLQETELVTHPKNANQEVDRRVEVVHKDLAFAASSVSVAEALHPKTVLISSKLIRPIQVPILVFSQSANAPPTFVELDWTF